MHISTKTTLSVFAFGETCAALGEPVSGQVACLLSSNRAAGSGRRWRCLRCTTKRTDPPQATKGCRSREKDGKCWSASGSE